MVRIFLIICTWASLSSAGSLDPRYKLLGTYSKSDDAFALVISDVNQYIKNKQFNVYKLMDFPVNLRYAHLNFSNGQISDLSSIELHMSSILPLSVGRLSWTLAVGLEQFSLKYDFKTDLFHVFKTSGNLKMKVPKNDIFLSGTIDVSSQRCSTTFGMVNFLEFPNVDVEVQPLNMKHYILKHIIGFAVNHSKGLLSSTLNTNLKDYILHLIPPSKFNEILCKHLSQFSRE